MYKVKWQPKALRQFEKIKNKEIRKKISGAVNGLENFPNCSGLKTLTNHSHDYRLRVDKYRILFDVWKGVHIIQIIEVKKRNESTY